MAQQSFSGGNIFISIGNGLTASQEAFVVAVEELVRQKEFEPVTIGRNSLVDTDVLQQVRVAIESTVATIVIVFERLHVIEGIEYPYSNTAVAITERHIPTVWNQIEAAITFQLDHPLVILCESTIHPEGIIDPLVFPLTLFMLDEEEKGLPAAVKDGILDWMTPLQPS